MNNLEAINQHIIIRDTVRYSTLEDIDIADIPEVLRFLEAVYNYKKILGIWI